MATFNIDMTEGICIDCKKKDFIAEKKICLACLAERLRLKSETHRI